MPIILAITGAVLSGLFMWLVWGQGLEYIDYRLRDRNTRKRDVKRRAAALEAERMAPLRSLKDPRDAAAVLMVMIARVRGEMTPEQTVVVEAKMRRVLGLSEETLSRLDYARFVAARAMSPESAVEDLTPLFREALTRSEQNDLLHMLRAVAEVHGGPTDRQEDVLDLLARRLATPR